MLNKKWTKVFLTCLGDMGYQINVKKNLITVLTSYNHNITHIEDCESLLNRIRALRRAQETLAGIKLDLTRAYSALDEKKRRILYLRHKKHYEYQVIAECTGLKLRSVFYQYDKAVTSISKRLERLGYTDNGLIEALQGDPLIIEGFCINERGY
ncbi:MAG: hypothetical protein ACOYIQ_02580 [Christensenellales bacterium]|jgi:hypothetical protein